MSAIGQNDISDAVPGVRSDSTACWISSSRPRGADTNASIEANSSNTRRAIASARKGGLDHVTGPVQEDAALDRSSVKEPVGGRHRHQRGDLAPAAGLSEDRHP